MPTPGLIASGAVTTDGSSFTTPAWQAQADRLVLVFVSAARADSIDVSFPAQAQQGSLVYNLVAQRPYKLSGTSRLGLACYAALSGSAPPDAGFVIDFGVTHSNIVWAAVQVSGTPLDSVEAAIRQEQSANATVPASSSLSIVHTLFPLASSLSLAAFAINSSSATALIERSGWSVLGTPGTGDAPVSRMLVEYRDPAEQTASAQNNTAGSLAMGGIFLEIQAATPPATGGVIVAVVGL